MIDLKDFVFVNKMVNFTIEFDPEDKSIQSFTMDKDAIETFKSLLASSDELDINKLVIVFRTIVYKVIYIN